MLPLNVEPLRKLGFPYPKDIAATYLLITPAQYKVFLIAHAVAPFSLFGSLAIIYRICRFDRHDRDANNRRTYHRLLVAMSTCDLFGTVSLLFGTAPIPKETLLETARGNATTCAAQGFFLHVFVVAVLYYNAGLMIYFVMTIRYGWSDTRTAKWVEPAIHTWSLLVPWAQGVAGLFLEIFNPIGFGNFCHISPYPLLCGLFENACTRGLSAHLLYTLFCIIPESVLLAIIYISIALIYCTVRSQARRALAFSANRESIRARTKAVAVQSWLFAIVFFFTWASSVLGPLLGYIAIQSQVKVRAIYILSVMTSTFMPLQGFFNFLIYIRPRFLRFWRDQGMSFWMALRLAVFGGQETILSQRRMSTLKLRRSSMQTVSNPLSSDPLSFNPQLEPGEVSPVDISGSIMKAESTEPTENGQEDIVGSQAAAGAVEDESANRIWEVNTWELNHDDANTHHQVPQNPSTAQDVNANRDEDVDSSQDSASFKRVTFSESPSPNA